MKYLQIILNLPVNQPFTYSYIPDENEKPELIPMIGKRAEIMFGNRKTSGFIIDILDSIPPSCPVDSSKIRPIKRIIDKEPLFDKELIDRINFVLQNEFVRLTYTEGIQILEEAIKNGKKFEFRVGWGTDLQSEHERYLVEEHFKRPVILTDYPKEIKSFYMKQNEDGKTVRAMDVLFPKIGEIIGGSEREADYEKLKTRAAEMGVPEKDIWWYLNTRRWGSAPHSGFGLGFERLLLFVTGMTNIRDVIPFPRTPNKLEF